MENPITPLSNIPENITKYELLKQTDKYASKLHPLIAHLPTYDLNLQPNYSTTETRVIGIGDNGGRSISNRFTQPKKPY